MLLAGYEGTKQREKTIPLPGMAHVLEVIEHLVQLYDATDRQDEAARWRAELDAINAAQKSTEEQP